MTSPATTARPVSDGQVSDDLYALSEQLGLRDPDNQSHGFLGGAWGYGQNFTNDVFTMFPFFWGDCECPSADAEDEWDRLHDHAADCYQTALAARGSDNCEQLAAEWGLSPFGSAVHCTCGHDTAYKAFMDQHPHAVECGTVRPNFRHHASGVEVRWYKYIGRDNELLTTGTGTGEMAVPANTVVTAVTWATLIEQCFTSLGERLVPPPQAPDDEDVLVDGFDLLRGDVQVTFPPGARLPAAVIDMFDPPTPGADHA